MVKPNKIIKETQKMLNERPKPNKETIKKMSKIIPKWAYRALVNDYIQVIRTIKKKDSHIITIRGALTTIDARHTFISKEAMLPKFIIPEIFNTALRFDKMGIKHIKEGDIEKL